jgi:beta-glucosidase
VTRAALLGLAAILSCPSCSSDATSVTPADDGPAEVTFQKDFLWGSASAAFQVEKGLGNTDWGIWVKTPGKIKNGDDPDVGGADALLHMDEDVALLGKTGQNAYRFSVEWARVFPTREAFDAGQPDAGALASYDALLAKLRAASITPLVTLQHFTMPSWLADPREPSKPQGWERPESIDAFAKWCTFAASRWGAEVDWWATINEPLVVPLGGYVQGGFPPGLTLELERALSVGKQEAIAHARCFDAIKAADPKSMVGIVQHLRAIEPEDPTDPGDVAAAARVRYVNTTWILDVVVRGDWDEELDGRLDGPRDRRADPTLAGRSDYIGLNYYSAAIASSRGLKLPVIDASIRLDNLPTERPKTDFHWDIHPKGFREVLDEVNVYRLPIVVTENGIADSRDTNRGRFLLEHLYELGRAMADGMDIRGYFYWSLLDNFEWNSGFCPKFGLHTVDPVTKARAPRPSADVYRRIATTGKVTKADIAAAPPYGAPSYCD